jgi:hypothetical protein
MDAVTKKEFNIRDLGTKSVTLFPTRAQIVREIKDLQLAVCSPSTSHQFHANPSSPASTKSQSSA